MNVQTFGQLSSEKIAAENEECRKIVREVINIGLTQRQQMFLIYLLSLELENISHVKDLTDVIKEIAGDEIFLSRSDNGKSD
jgi:hypothetical protein